MRAGCTFLCICFAFAFPFRLQLRFSFVVENFHQLKSQMNSNNNNNNKWFCGWESRRKLCSGGKVAYEQIECMISEYKHKWMRLARLNPLFLCFVRFLVFSSACLFVCLCLLCFRLPQSKREAKPVILIALSKWDGANGWCCGICFS